VPNASVKDWQVALYDLKPGPFQTAVVRSIWSLHGSRPLPEAMTALNQIT
jgi:hypothetical protein